MTVELKRIGECKGAYVVGNGTTFGCIDKCDIPDDEIVVIGKKDFELLMKKKDESSFAAIIQAADRVLDHKRFIAKIGYNIWELCHVPQASDSELSDMMSLNREMQEVKESLNGLAALLPAELETFASHLYMVLDILSGLRIDVRHYTTLSSDEQLIVWSFIDEVNVLHGVLNWVSNGD